MTYEFFTNYNLADSKTSDYSLIPSGTLAKVVMNIRPGGYGPDNYFTQNPKSGAVYVSAEFTITEGPYAKRKIFQCIGISGTQQKDTWGENGRAMLRSIIESARNIRPNDISDEAQEKRILSNPSDHCGLECAVKIGVEHNKDGKFAPKNIILAVLTPEHRQYNEVMGNNTLDSYDNNLEDIF